MYLHTKNLTFYRRLRLSLVRALQTDRQTDTDRQTHTDRQTDRRDWKYCHTAFARDKMWPVFFRATLTIPFLRGYDVAARESHWSAVSFVRGSWYRLSCTLVPTYHIPNIRFAAQRITLRTKWIVTEAVVVATSHRHGLRRAAIAR